MRTALVALVVLMGALQVFAYSQVQIQQNGYDSQGDNSRDDTRDNSRGGRSGQNIAIYAKNKNKNVNDIAIGTGADNTDNVMQNEGSDDTDEIRVNWSGSHRRRDSDSNSHHSDDSDDSDDSSDTWESDDSDSYSDRDSDSRGNVGGRGGYWNGTNNAGTGGSVLPGAVNVGTGTTGGSVGTDPTLCYCDWSNGTYGQSCNFSSFDVQLHCDKRGFSKCRAMCTAAETIHWADCSPVGSTTTTCYCPGLHIWKRTFTVPDTAFGAAMFWDLRYQTCYRQCRDSGSDSRYGSDSGYGSGSYGSYGSYRSRSRRGGWRSRSDSRSKYGRGRRHHRRSRSYSSYETDSRTYSRDSSDSGRYRAKAKAL